MALIALLTPFPLSVIAVWLGLPKASLLLLNCVYLVFSCFDGPPWLVLSPLAALLVCLILLKSPLKSTLDITSLLAFDSGMVVLGIKFSLNRDY